MKMQWEKKLDIRGPLEQAERCLAQWLKEEKRHLNTRQRQRVAALMARYFYHEDEVTDQLMLSFLRHYSGHNAMDLEDPTSVRMEIKSLLDKSQEGEVEMKSRTPVLLTAAFSVLFAAFAGWHFTHQKITREQQEELRTLVKEIDARDPALTSAAIWRAVKEPLQVRRYEEMTWWDYKRSKKFLQEKLAN